MLMDHPPQIIACGRENAPQRYFEGLTPVQGSVVVEELVACDSQVQEALADPLEVVQEIAQAGPYPFHRVTVHTGTVRVTPRGLACAMVDRPLVIVGVSAMGEVVCIGAELRPGLHLGGHDGLNRRAADVLSHCAIHVRGWRVRVCLVAALHQAQQGGTAHLGGGSTTKRDSALSGGAVVACDCTGP